MGKNNELCHCEERSDEAILAWIASPSLPAGRQESIPFKIMDTRFRRYDLFKIFTLPPFSNLLHKKKIYNNVAKLYNKIT